MKVTLTIEQKDKISAAYKELSNMFDINTLFIMQNTASGYDNANSLRGRKLGNMSLQRQSIAVSYKVINALCPEHEILKRLEAVLPMAFGKFIIQYVISKQDKIHSVHLYTPNELEGNIKGILVSKHFQEYTRGASFERMPNELVKDSLITPAQRDSIITAFRNNESVVIGLAGELINISNTQ